jgi:hypothetical protein
MASQRPGCIIITGRSDSLAQKSHDPDVGATPNDRLGIAGRAKNGAKYELRPHVLLMQPEKTLSSPEVANTRANPAVSRGVSVIVQPLF